LKIVEPGSDKAQFPAGKNPGGDEGLVTAQQVRASGLRAMSESDGFEHLAYALVGEVAGHLIGEVAHEPVRIAVLDRIRSMKGEMRVHFPKATLGDQAAPDIGHAESATAREIHQGIGWWPPPGVLAVERAPDARG